MDKDFYLWRSKLNRTDFIKRKKTINQIDRPNLNTLMEQLYNM